MWGLRPAGGARYHHGVMWLLKTEPSTYGYDDLERDGQTRWDGVTNPVALRNLRAMKVGDAAAEAAEQLGFTGNNPTFMNASAEILDRSRPLVAEKVAYGDVLELVDVGGGV